MSETVTLTKQQIEMIAMASMIAGTAIHLDVPLEAIQIVSIEKLKAIYPSVDEAIIRDCAFIVLPIAETLLRNVHVWNDEGGSIQ
jgi:hypothetical protein